MDWPDNFFAIYDTVADLTKGWRFVIWDTDLGFPDFDLLVNKVTPAGGVAALASHDAPFAVDAGLCVVAAGCFLIAVPIASTSTKLEPISWM